MLKNLFVAVVFLCFSSVASAYNVLESVCKVHAGNAMGTGTCIDIYEGTIFVLTNAHVVGSSRNVTCQFYRAGHQSTEIRGQVVWRAMLKGDSVDLAVITIDASQLGGYLPTIVKFGDPQKTLEPTSTILTVGCPEGKWPALVKGHLIRNSNGVHYIKPPVENGRSGSALLDENENIVGIITWRSGDNHNGVGMAQDLRTIYAAMSGNMSYRKMDDKNDYWRLDGEFIPARKYAHLTQEHGRFFVQIQCGPDGCSPYGFSPFGGRGQTDPGGGGQGQAPNGNRLFPTLPGGPDPNLPPQTDPGYPDLQRPQPHQPNCCDELKQRVDGVDEKIAELSEKIDQNTDAIGIINEGQVVQDGKLVDLYEKYAELKTGKEDRGEGVTPGNLEKELEKYNYITPGDIDGKYVKVEDVEAYKQEMHKDISEIVKETQVTREQVVKQETSLSQIFGVLQSGDLKGVLDLSSALGLGGSIGGFVMLGLGILGWFMRKNGQQPIVFTMPQTQSGPGESTPAPFQTMTK